MGGAEPSGGPGGVGGKTDAKKGGGALAKVSMKMNCSSFPKVLLLLSIPKVLFLLLSSLGLSDTQVYKPQIRALQDVVALHTPDHKGIL